MQTAAPEAIDLSRESKITHDLYGTEDPKCKVFAKQCLTARRLLERGVRFIQIFAGKNVGGDGAVDDVPWDGHNNIETNHRECGLATDRPAAALLADLKAAGMLEDTPVIWGGGEFASPLATLVRPSEEPKVDRRQPPEDIVKIMHSSSSVFLWHKNRPGRPPATVPTRR